jgi:hypothetical protein
LVAPRGKHGSLRAQRRRASRPTPPLHGIPASCCCDLIYRFRQPYAIAASHPGASHIGVTAPLKPTAIPGYPHRTLPDLLPPLSPRCTCAILESGRFSAFSPMLKSSTRILSSESFRK